MYFFYQLPVCTKSTCPPRDRFMGTIAFSPRPPPCMNRMRKCAGTASSSRRAASASAAICMNSLPRWLISITPTPQPCQSSISAAASRSTGSGMAAGPGAKFQGRFESAIASGRRIAGVRRRFAFGRALAILDVRVVLDDALQARQLGAVVQRDQRDALRGPPELAHLAHPRAHEHALVGDQHDLVVRAHQRGRDDLAVALALLDGDHALGAAAVARVFDDRGALAKAVLGRSEHAL